MHRDEVAHELRTPLTTIKGVLRMLDGGRMSRFTEADTGDLISRAWQQVVRLEQVVARVEAHFAADMDTEEAVVLCEEAG